MKNTADTSQIERWFTDTLANYKTYDYNPDPYVLSATTLYKPIKKIVLANHYKPAKFDLNRKLAALMGTMLHDQLEHIVKMPFAKKIIKKHFGKKAIVIIEVRAKYQVKMKGFKKFTITGKNDLIINNSLVDYKSTKAFKAEKCAEDAKGMKQFIKEGYTDLPRLQQLCPNMYEYILQGSTLAFIHNNGKNKHKIDSFFIIHLMMDYSLMCKLDSPVQFLSVPILSNKEFKMYLKERLSEYKLAMKLKKKDLYVLADCNKTELWMSDTVWKYYATANSVRATRVFNNPQEAHDYASGKTGTVKETLGEPKACNYCDMFDHCKQGQRYKAMGLIK